jgi:hypothetical protein
VQARKALGEAVGFGVDDEVDLALPVQQHVLVAVAGDGHEAHALEQRAHRGRVRRGVLDELEAVGAHRVVPGGEGHRVSPVALGETRHFRFAHTQLVCKSWRRMGPHRRRSARIERWTQKSAWMR